LEKALTFQIVVNPSKTSCKKPKSSPDREKLILLKNRQPSIVFLQQKMARHQNIARKTARF
jgi:hypothetical protein